MQMGLKGEKEQESWGLGGGNGKRREQGSGRKPVQKRKQRLISHQLGPRESSGLREGTWRGDWLEEDGGGQSGCAGLGVETVLPPKKVLALITEKEREAESGGDWPNYPAGAGVALRPDLLKVVCDAWGTVAQVSDTPRSPRRGASSACFLPISLNPTAKLPGAARNTCPKPLKVLEKCSQLGRGPAERRDWWEGLERGGNPGAEAGAGQEGRQGGRKEQGNSKMLRRISWGPGPGPAPAHCVALGAPICKQLPGIVPDANLLCIYQHA